MAPQVRACPALADGPAGGFALLPLAELRPESSTELRRRIEYWLPLRGIQANEIKAVCHHYGITDADALQYVQQVCDNYGSLKGMITAYDKAMRNTKPELIKTQREMLYHLRFGHTQDDAPAKGKGLKAA